MAAAKRKRKPRIIRRYVVEAPMPSGRPRRTTVVAKDKVDARKKAPAALNRAHIDHRGFAVLGYRLGRG